MSEPDPTSGGGTWSDGGPPPPPPPGWASPPVWNQQPGWGQPGSTQPGWGQSPWGAYAPPPSPKPGVVPLRPLAVGELLDGAFTMMRRYPKAVLGLSAGVALIIEAVRVIASYSLLHGVHVDQDLFSPDASDNGDFLARNAAVSLIVVVVGYFGGLLLSGMITSVVGQAVLGRPVTPGDAWRTTRPMLLKLLGVSMLVALIGLAILIVGALPGILIAVAGAGGAGVIVGVLGVLAAGILAVYVLVLLSLATPVLVLEKSRVVESLRRSRMLVAGAWWRVTGITFLAGLLAALISGVITVPFSIAAGAGSVFSGHVTSDQFQFTPLLINGIGGLIAITITRPFSSGVLALLYIDRRMRAEGLDMTLQQAAAG